MKQNFALIYLCILLIITQASAGTSEIIGGWNIAGEGQQKNSGTSHLGYSGGDPSITIGISSESSLFGPGDSSRTWEGSQNIAIDISGYHLEASYDGKVDSNVILTSQGTASAAAFIGASSSGMATGYIPSTNSESYDLFGWADISTDGFIYGQGTADSTATGSASYDVQKLGTTPEVWGQASGSSSMSLESGSSAGIISTGGTTNGLHAESRVTKTATGDISASASSQLTSYASVMNKGNADVQVTGSANGGAWDPTFSGTKVRMTESGGNENVATQVRGTLGTLDQKVETLEDNDAADVSSILQSTASKYLTASGELTLKASGGPATYAAASQSSSSTETHALTWVKDALWGSLARSKDSQLALEWGKVDSVGAGAICNEPSNALSFAKILMTADYTSADRVARATGNMTISTYAQATNGTKAIGGAAISGTGQGDILSSDNLMTNNAGYTGGMSHISFVDASKSYAKTSNVADRIFAGADPHGSFGVSKPFQTNTTTAQNLAWSSSIGYYDQSR